VDISVCAQSRIDGRNTEQERTALALNGVQYVANFKLRRQDQFSANGKTKVHHGHAKCVAEGYQDQTYLVAGPDPGRERFELRRVGVKVCVG
jgi:hypothetical protein